MREEGKKDGAASGLVDAPARGLCWSGELGGAPSWASCSCRGSAGSDGWLASIV
jgi:hypothetical protein